MPLPKRQPNNAHDRRLAKMRAAKANQPPQEQKYVRVNAALIDAAKVAPQSGPVPEVSDLDTAFQGRWRELLPKYDDLTPDEKNGRGPFCDALNSLFFSGGKLSDHGITPKPGIELGKVMRYIRATLGDFGPSHEHKIGGIAHMLAQWCDIKPKERK